MGRSVAKMEMAGDSGRDRVVLWKWTTLRSC